MQSFITLGMKVTPVTGQQQKKKFQISTTTLNNFDSYQVNFLMQGMIVTIRTVLFYFYKNNDKTNEKLIAKLTVLIVRYLIISRKIDVQKIGFMVQKL